MIIVRTRSSGAEREKDLLDLGDDVASLVNNDGVANADVEASDFVGVME